MTVNGSKGIWDALRRGLCPAGAGKKASYCGPLESGTFDLKGYDPSSSYKIWRTPPEVEFCGDASTLKGIVAGDGADAAERAKIEGDCARILAVHRKNRRLVLGIGTALLALLGAAASVLLSKKDKGKGGRREDMPPPWPRPVGPEPIRLEPASPEPAMAETAAAQQGSVAAAGGVPPSQPTQDLPAAISAIAERLKAGDPMGLNSPIAEALDGLAEEVWSQGEADFFGDEGNMALFDRIFATALRRLATAWLPEIAAAVAAARGTNSSQRAAEVASAYTNTVSDNGTNAAAAGGEVNGRGKGGLNWEIAVRQMAIAAGKGGDALLQVLAILLPITRAQGTGDEATAWLPLLEGFKSVADGMIQLVLSAGGIATLPNRATAWAEPLRIADWDWQGAWWTGRGGSDHRQAFSDASSAIPPELSRGLGAAWLDALVSAAIATTTATARERDARIATVDVSAKHIPQAHRFALFTAIRNALVDVMLLAPRGATVDILQHPFVDYPPKFITIIARDTGLRRDISLTPLWDEGRAALNADDLYRSPADGRHETHDAPSSIRLALSRRFDTAWLDSLVHTAVAMSADSAMAKDIAITAHRPTAELVPEGKRIALLAALRQTLAEVIAAAPDGASIYVEQGPPAGYRPKRLSVGVMGNPEIRRVIDLTEFLPTASPLDASETGEPPQPAHAALAALIGRLGEPLRGLREAGRAHGFKTDGFDAYLGGIAKVLERNGFDRADGDKARAEGFLRLSLRELPRLTHELASHWEKRVIEEIIPDEMEELTKAVQAAEAGDIAGGRTRIAAAKQRGDGILAAHTALGNFRDALEGVVGDLRESGAATDEELKAISSATGRLTGIKHDTGNMLTTAYNLPALLGKKVDIGDIAAMKDFLGSLKYDISHLDALLESATSLNEQAGKAKDIRIAVQGLGESLPIPEDSRRPLLRIVFEAVRNSVIHSGGRNIAVAAGHVDGGVRVSISDDGPGLTKPDLQDIVTGRVRRLHQDEEGTGDGIVTLRGLCGRRNWGFEIVSRQGAAHGTTVTVTIRDPWASSVPPANAGGAAPSGESDGEGSGGTAVASGAVGLASAGAPTFRMTWFPLSAPRGKGAADKKKAAAVRNAAADGPPHSASPTGASLHGAQLFMGFPFGAKAVPAFIPLR